jgi:hypothetical protein
MVVLSIYSGVIWYFEPKHETKDLQMDIHPGLGVLATEN